MACGVAEGGASCAGLIASIPTHEWAGLYRRASPRGGLLLFCPLGFTADSVTLRRVLACEGANHHGGFFLSPGYYIAGYYCARIRDGMLLLQSMRG